MSEVFLKVLKTLLTESTSISELCSCRKLRRGYVRSCNAVPIIGTCRHTRPAASSPSWPASSASRPSRHCQPAAAAAADWPRCRSSRVSSPWLSGIVPTPIVPTPIAGRRRRRCRRWLAPLPASPGQLAVVFLCSRVVAPLPFFLTGSHPT